MDKADVINKGQVHIYTGSGKGKTTAALGLALRAAGWDKKVIFFQFLKPPTLKTGERLAIQNSGLPIKIDCTGFEWDMQNSFNDPAQVQNAQQQIKQILSEITKSARKNKYDIIILDEMVFCVSKNLADIEDIKNLIKSKSPDVDIVLTGAGPTDAILNLADLITEMKPLKHPYDKGTPAKKGLEF